MTARKWAARYRAEGRPGWPTGPVAAALAARPRPRRRWCAQIVRLRWRHRLGPVQIAGRLGMPASTVHAVLVRCRINRLCHIDRVTGEPIRRYEHPHPGSLIHVDVTKFGNIPDGGGWRYVGRQQGDANEPATARGPANAASDYQPLIGTAFLHTVIDDHSRVAYVEICADEKAATAIGVLHRAVAWFADRGVTVERVLSDNGCGLPVPRLARRLRRARHHPQTHPALPAPDQRQDRTLPPHPGRRLGLRPLLRLRNRTPSRPARAGSTSTITTGPTPPSAATTHQQADQPLVEALAGKRHARGWGLRRLATRGRGAGGPVRTLLVLTHQLNTNLVLVPTHSRDREGRKHWRAWKR